MATHKVPQDVEADDKLIGFLSLKQFIFVIIGMASGWLGFVFATKIHPLAALVWIPPTVVFLVLGLYQRKDQPVEVYLASALRFYLKPHKRKWDQEGFEERVIVTAPPKMEKHYTKSFTGEEATSRLGNLSRLMDSRGWATKMVSEWQNPEFATAAGSDRLVHPGELQVAGIDPQMYMQQAPDVMDESSSLVSMDFQNRINQTDGSARAHALQTMQQARQATQDDATSTPANDDTPAPSYQKYPEMHQRVVTPTNDTPVTAVPVPEPPQQAAVADPVAAPAPEPEPVKPAEPTEQITDDGSVEIKLH